MIPKYQKRVNGTYKENAKLNSVGVESHIGRGISSIGKGLSDVGDTLFRQSLDEKNDLYRLNLQNKVKEDDLVYRSSVQAFDSMASEGYFSNVYNKNGDELEESFNNFIVDLDNQYAFLDANVKDPFVKKNLFIHYTNEKNKYTVNHLKLVSDKKLEFSNELTKAEINDNYNSCLRDNNPDLFFNREQDILKSHCKQNGLDPRVGYTKSGLSEVAKTYSVNQVGKYLSIGDIDSASAMLHKFKERIDPSTYQLCQSKIKGEINFNDIRRNSVDDNGEIQFHKANKYIDSMMGVGEEEKANLKKRTLAEIKMQGDAKDSTNSYIVNSFKKKLAGKNYVDAVKILSDEIAVNPMLKENLNLQFDKYYPKEIELHKINQGEAKKKNDLQSYSKGINYIVKKIVNDSYSSYNKDVTAYKIESDLLNLGYSTDVVEKISKSAMNRIDTINARKADVSSYFYKLSNFPAEQVDTATAVVLSGIDNPQDLTKEQMNVEIQKGCNRVVLAQSKGLIWGVNINEKKLEEIKSGENIRLPEIRKNLPILRTNIQKYLIDKNTDGHDKNKLRKSLYDYGAMNTLGGLNIDNEVIEDWYTFGVLKHPMKEEDKVRINERRKAEQGLLSEEIKDNLLSVGEYQDVISEDYLNRQFIELESRKVIK